MVFRKSNAQWFPSFTVFQQVYFGVQFKFEVDLYTVYMKVSISGGIQKWLVYKGNPIKMDDLEVTLFQETTTYIYIYMYISR